MGIGIFSSDEQKIFQKEDMLHIHVLYVCTDIIFGLRSMQQLLDILATIILIILNIIIHMFNFQCSLVIRHPYPQRITFTMQF